MTYPKTLNVSGQNFSFGGFNPNGTTNWTRGDGQQFNNLTKEEFAKYAPDYVNAYYGQGGANMTPGYAPPAPGSATATNPFLNLGLNAYQQTQKPFDTSWLDNMSKSLYQQGTQNLQDNVFPGMNSNAIMAGGYGQERSQLGMGVAADRMNQNVINAMAPQYAQAYQSGLDRALQGGNAAANVGSNLEQLDLNRMLGVVGAQNQTRGLDATISQNAADLALREMLGLTGLENQRMSVENDTARVAQNAAGVPTYTNPLAAGIGGAGSIAELLRLILNEKG